MSFARGVRAVRKPLTRAFSSAGRVSNFNAGPAGVPLQVLEEAHKDFFNYKGCGMSVMEMSHRSKEFDDIIVTAEKDLRDLLKIDDKYTVSFLQGGASTQFAAVPLNFLKENGQCEYVVTGAWSKKAAKEAKKYTNPTVVADSSDKNFTYIPAESTWKRNTNAPAYLHYCANETVHGVEFNFVPKVADGQALIADFSSSFCSAPIDVNKFGAIYAGAQKNIGPAGMTVAIVRKDLLGTPHPTTPTMLDLTVQAGKLSLYNTPPCWSIYIAGLTFKWLKNTGGLAGIAQINAEKAKTLYTTIDNSDFYHAPVEKEVRSKMNVPFRVGKGGPNKDIEAKFIKEATAAGLVGLKGHRDVGGCRASIYNSVTLEDVQKLSNFMKTFESKNK